MNANVQREFDTKTYLCENAVKGGGRGEADDLKGHDCIHTGCSLARGHLQKAMKYTTTASRAHPIQMGTGIHNFTPNIAAPTSRESKACKC